MVVKGRGGKVLMQDKISRPGSQNLLKGAGLLVPDFDPAGAVNRSGFTASESRRAPFVDLRIGR